MKINRFAELWIFAAVFVLSVHQVGAVTLAIGTGEFRTGGVMMSDQVGNPLESGGYIITAGTFDTDPFTRNPDAPFSLAGFHAFGSALSPVSGFTMGVITGSITHFENREVFDGAPIYLVVGDGPSLATSSFMVALKSSDGSWRFPDDITEGGALTLSAHRSRLSIFGGIIEAPLSSGAPAIIRPQWWPVPEPGTAFLAGIGALLTGRRRKGVRH